MILVVYQAVGGPFFKKNILKKNKKYDKYVIGIYK